MDKFNLLVTSGISLSIIHYPLCIVHRPLFQSHATTSVFVPDRRAICLVWASGATR